MVTKIFLKQRIIKRIQKKDYRTTLKKHKLKQMNLRKDIDRKISKEIQTKTKTIY